MKLKSVIIVVILTLVLSSCGSKKKVVQQTKPKVEVVEPIPEEKPSVNQIEHIKKLKKTKNNLNNHTIAYIRKFAPIAVSEMHQYKIPASITLAQGILESGNGRSKLAVRSNNHFGIKCHKGWKGKSVSHDDDKKGECFRKYKFPETSYKDHSIFLSSRKRYAKLFTLSMTDYKGWAKGLRKAGYATDRKYPQKLIRIIKNYRLYEFDDMQPDGTKAEISNTIPTSYKVKRGDTLYSISRKYKITVEDLKRLNDLKGNAINVGQELRIQ